METNDKQDCSNFEQKQASLETVEALWGVAKNGDLNAEFYIVLFEAIKQLPEDERRKFLRGKRGKIKAGLWESSRSGGYELFNASAISLVLKEMEFIKPGPHNTWIDVQTGKRVTTKIRELGRLEWLRQADDKAKTWLKENWPTIATYHIDMFKLWVRENNPNAKESTQ